MIFVATVKESVRTGPATEQHTLISQTEAVGGQVVGWVFLWSTPGKNMKIDDLT